MGVLPFYGATEPELFAIERAAMDRPQAVVAALDDALPDGIVLDIGAGSGHTASRLQTTDRSVVALEPAAGMIDTAASVPWVRGDAEHLPFADDTIDAVYATWAYFFSRDFDPGPGLREARRVVRPGGVVAVVDNLGSDEFCALASSDISADPAFWERLGFDLDVIDTVFDFDHLDDARRLLSRFFGEVGASVDRTRFTFRVGLWSTHVAGEQPPL